MHPPGLIELAHRRVDQRVAGAPGLPRGKKLGCIVPAQGVELGLEAARNHARMVPENGVIKVAPDQFREPGCRAATGLRMGVGGKLADRNGAEAQVGREVGTALLRRVVALRGIVVDALGEVAEQHLGAAHARWQAERGEVRGDKAELFQAGQPVAGTRRREVCRHGFDRKRLQVARREPAQPGVLVGCEHREGRAALGHQLVAFEDHLVLEV